MNGCPVQNIIIAKPNEHNEEKIIPPKNPSHVFLGEIRGFILCFPKKTPTKYAPISVINVAMRTYKNKVEDSKFVYKLNK